MKPILKRILRLTLATAFWIALWAFAAHRVGKPLLFPSPATVVGRLWEMLGTASFYRITARSLWNVTSGIVIAMLGGSVLSILTARIPLLRDLLLPIMTVIKTTPVASFIVLALIWIGSAKVPSFITVLIVLPIVWTNLDVGFSKIDPQLSELTRVYRFSPKRRLQMLVIPSLKPYFVSACRTSIGLAWKAGIAAEIIAMPFGTVGMMIGEAKLYIMTTDMYAWTLTVILLSLIIEFAFSTLLGLITKTPSESEV